MRLLYEPGFRWLSVMWGGGVGGMGGGQREVLESTAGILGECQIPHLGKTVHAMSQHNGILPLSPRSIILPLNQEPTIFVTGRLGVKEPLDIQFCKLSHPPVPKHCLAGPRYPRYGWPSCVSSTSGTL